MTFLAHATHWLLNVVYVAPLLVLAAAGRDAPVNLVTVDVWPSTFAIRA